MLKVHSFDFTIEDPVYLLFISLLPCEVSIKKHKERENMDTTNTTDQTTPNQSTTLERMEKNNYKIPTLSEKETDLTKTNPRMSWESISEILASYTRKT